MGWGILDALHLRSSLTKGAKFAQLILDEQKRRTAAGEPPIDGDEWKDWYHRDGEPRFELVKTGGPIKNKQRRNRPRSDSAPGGWHQNPNPGRGEPRPRNDPSLNRFTGEPLAWERTREGRREIARQAEERRRRQHQQRQQPRNGHRNREREHIPQQGHGSSERDPVRPRVPPPARDPVPIPQSRRESQAPEPAPASEAPASAPPAAGGRHHWRPDETVGRASSTVRFRMPGPTEGRNQQTTVQQPQPPQPSRTAVGGGAAEQSQPASRPTSHKGPGGLFGWGLGPMDAPGPPAPTVVQPRPGSGSNRRRS